MTGLKRPADGNTENQKEAEVLKTVSYIELVPILVEAVKQQQESIEKQNALIEQLNKRILELENK